MRRWWKRDDTIRALASPGRRIEPGSQEAYELGLHGCVMINAETHDAYDPRDVATIFDPDTREIIGYLVRRR